MTPLTWVALAAACAVAALPDPVVVRAGGLAAAGRLVSEPPSATGRRASVVAVRVAGWVSAVAVLGVVAWRGGPALTLAAAAVLGVGALLGRDALRAGHATARHRELLTAVRVLAGELTAGARPADALVAAAATGVHAAELIGPAGQAQLAGDDAAAVLAASDEAGVRALAVAWRLGAATGAALADVVDRVAADLAARDTRRRAVTVAVAGPRSSAVLLAGLPGIGVALGAAMGAGPVAFLLTDPVGRVVCCAGVLLDVAGLLWIRRIVARVQR